MTTANACCTPVVVPTHRPLALRWLEDVREDLLAAWSNWQAARRAHAEQRTLDALSDATLRDIGLAERRWDDPTLSRVDWERGRWQ
jgi:uncharacterized protein YjiS (DUF1127 family)